MLLNIDPKSGAPIYMQLYNQIVYLIRSGSLTPGESLPSVRKIAENLNINSMTVNKTYSLLRKEGFIITNERKPAKINNLDLIQKNSDDINKIYKNLTYIISELSLKGITKDELIKTCGEIFENLNEKEAVTEKEPIKKSEFEIWL